MADAKISALTNLTAADAINDMIPIVDVSDTPPASGNTKRISINNLLSSSPTASGALTVTGLVTAGSATITGDLTVDTSTLKVDSTNNRVGIVQATPLYPLHLVGEFGLEEASAGNGSKLRMIGQSTKYNFRLGKQIAVDNAFEITPSTAVGGTTFTNPVYTVTYDGIHTFLDGAGGTRMTLNSSGLGVQVTPSAPLCVKTRNSDSVGLRVLQSTGGTAGIQFTDDPVTADWGSILATSTNVILRSNSFLQFQTGGATERMRIDSSGNLIPILTATPPTLATNSQMVFNLTSNTNLRISVRGTDGTTRTANITLA
jgi:hypothetical protein